MNAARALLGVYVPGTTVWHRLGVGAKYLVFLAVTLPAVVLRDPVWVLGSLAVAMALVATTGAPLRLAWGLPRVLALMLGVLATFHTLAGAPEVAVSVVGIMLVALYGSRLVLLTTPMPTLIDALVRAVGPLRRFGVNPERFGLAVALVIRSVPCVVASFGEVRDAARARGLSRNPVASVTPVVIQTVAFARSTGQALMARGLGDDDG